MLDWQLSAETAGTGSEKNRVRHDVAGGSSSRFLTTYVVVIALSAALFGGEEAAWGQVVPVFGIDPLLLFCPLRTLPNRTVLIELVGLVCTGLLAFLPSRWFVNQDGIGSFARWFPSFPGGNAGGFA